MFIFLFGLLLPVVFTRDVLGRRLKDVNREAIVFVSRNVIRLATW